jgi:hypothetical protein
MEIIGQVHFRPFISAVWGRETQHRMSQKAEINIPAHAENVALIIQFASRLMMT